MKRRFPWWLIVPCVLVVACAGILGIRSRAEQPFEHRAHVTQGIACVQCHQRVAGSDAHAPIDLPTTQKCVSCHQKPHDTRDCAACHGREADRRGAAQAKQHLAFSHKAHAGTSVRDCMRCHDSVLLRDGPLRPPMATCLGCHEHREQWAERSCLPCHTDMEREGTRPQSHVVHGESFLRRHGVEAASARDLCASCHTESSCAECHGVAVPALPSTYHFDDPHRADMHKQGFAARHALEARVDPAMCTSCHRDESTCRNCHLKKGLLTATDTRASPHPADWVGTSSQGNRHGVEARQNPVACASCHGGAGESLCVGCHRVGGPGGNPHPPGFRSSKQNHEMPCRMCHSEAP